MNRIASTGIAVLGLAAIAWAAVPARADAAQTGREEFFSIVGDPANDEPVMLQGEDQFVLTQTVLGDGTVWRVFRLSVHGRGMGLWSGTPYVFGDTYTYSWFDPPGLEYQADLRDFTRLISLGARPNVMITQTMSVIRDANGQYTFKFAYDYDITGRPE